MGTQQSGILNLKIADLVKDQDILKLARHKAIELLKEDIRLEQPEHQKLKEIFESLAQKNNIWNYIS
jgi:ATP-dependent DNA helicase RecG